MQVVPVPLRLLQVLLWLVPVLLEPGLGLAGWC